MSAGRVQTPVLNWIVNRTKYAIKNKIELINIELENGFKIPPLKLPIGSYKKLYETKEVMVENIEKEIKEIYLPSPYTTDTLLSDAIRYLRINSNEAMKIAQDLFEVGLITYPRTDSTTVSTIGMNIAKQYLNKMDKIEFYVAREWMMEGAHECIRPTKPLDVRELEIMLRGKLIKTPIPITEKHLEMYNLIFKRFIASQMKPVKIEYANVTFNILGELRKFAFPILIKEYGFNIIKPIKTLFIDIYEIFKKKTLSIKRMDKKIVSEKPFYNEAEIVKVMKEKNIGRPSTYALTITKLKDKEYIIEKRDRLLSTKLGEEVLNFLNEHFSELINEERTRELLENMDKVEKGEVDFLEIIKSVKDEIEYTIFQNIENKILYAPT